MFPRLNQFMYWQNRVQRRIGHTVAWLALILVLLTTLAVVLRYGFDFSSSKLDESLTYSYALLFMLGLAYTLQQNAHVRVGVFYENFNVRHQAWINLIGTLLFIIPVMVFIIWSGWDYVAASWRILERSNDASGLAYVYLLKSVILLAALLVLLQALAQTAQYALELFAADKLETRAQSANFNDDRSNLAEDA